VSLHPNCKKHFKKSTKVDVEYNKTRVNKTKRRIPGVELRIHSHSASIIIINWRCAKNQQKGNIQGNFMEHSRNVLGTFGEQSGTIREHSGNNSGRVEQTPVSLHPNCKKHFKKSTKVDVEYNLQT
jgi:hypothetical protein